MSLSTWARLSVTTSKLRLSTIQHVQRRNASFYSVDVAGLTEEQSEFRKAVGDFAQREIAPRAAEIDKSNTFPSVRRSEVSI